MDVLQDGMDLENDGDVDVEAYVSLKIQNQSLQSEPISSEPGRVHLRNRFDVCEQTGINK